MLRSLGVGTPTCHLEGHMWAHNTRESFRGRSQSLQSISPVSSFFFSQQLNRKDNWWLHRRAHEKSKGDGTLKFTDWVIRIHGLQFGLEGLYSHVHTWTHTYIHMFTQMQPSMFSCLVFVHYLANIRIPQLAFGTMDLKFNAPQREETSISSLQKGWQRPLEFIALKRSKKISLFHSRN